MKRRTSSGFTLLEALVTLVIVALIVTALMQALTQALSMRTSLIRHQRETREGALQEMWFRESVAGAVADLPDAYGPMTGGATGFEMMTLAPLAGAGLVRAGWRLEPVDGGEALHYRDARLGDVVVLRGPLQRAGFTYLDPAGQWQLEWRPQDGDDDAIPRAVRLTARGAVRDIAWTVAVPARPRAPQVLRLQEGAADAF